MEDDLVVYTAIFGDIKDRLRPPIGFNPDARTSFVCFTDRPIQDAGLWKIRAPLWVSPSDARRTARFHKIMVHQVLPTATYWLWSDACLGLKVNPRNILAAVKGCELAAFKHPQRQCVYDEYEACRRWRKDNADVMSAQMDKYRFLGYPPANGLAETACVVRKNTPEVANFNTLWWRQLEEHSLRDQLSFDFTAWRFEITYGRIPGCRDKSNYFTYHPHPARRGRR